MLIKDYLPTYMFTWVLSTDNQWYNQLYPFLAVANVIQEDKIITWNFNQDLRCKAKPHCSFQTVWLLCQSSLVIGNQNYDLVSLFGLYCIKVASCSVVSITMYPWPGALLQSCLVQISLFICTYSCNNSMLKSFSIL